MRRQLLPAIAIGLALLLPTSALACVPIPAKTWKGTISYALTPQSVSSNVFTNNNCKWPDPKVNGFDAIVFDVAKYKGLKATATWNTTMAVKPLTVYGYFRTASCAPIKAWWQQDKAGQAKSFKFPSNVKWLMVVPHPSLVPTKDITVTIKSPGRKCK